MTPVRRPYTLAAFATLLCLQACTRGIRVHATPGSESLRSVSTGGSARARLGSVKVFLNGSETIPNKDFVANVESKLRETGLFNQVSPELPEGRPVFNLSLTARERVDPHVGANFTKGFFVGLTFFALTPALPITVDRDLDLTLDANRWDGESRHYRSTAEGRLSMTIFGDGLVAGAKLAGQV